MSNRYDFYGPIHKGLRLGHARFLERIGCADFDDAPIRATLLRDLRFFLSLAKEHLEHEDAEMNVLVRQFAAELGATLDDDHADHYDTFHRLEAAIIRVETAADADRAAAARALYLAYAEYVAEDIAHMAREEQEALPLFQARYSDDEMAAMEGRIIAAIAPDRMMAYLRLMLPAATPTERAAFLRFVQKGAPPEAFSAILYDAAKPTLTPRDWGRLAEEFRVAA